MAELVTILAQLFLPLSIILIALFTGRAIERRHFRQLEQQEAALSSILISDVKTIPANWNVEETFLVVGSVVVATDYFKQFAASLRNLFGGRVYSLERLVERGRREAIVRMLTQAEDVAANTVWNLRIETSSIQGKRANSFGGVEVMAYGTALRVKV